MGPFSSHIRVRRLLFSMQCNQCEASGGVPHSSELTQG